MTSDESKKPIQFPGIQLPMTHEGQYIDRGDPEPDTDPDLGQGPFLGAEGIPLSPEISKAMGIILSKSFVLVGIEPTESGADFFTVVEGDDQDLLNALEHLDGVIRRAYHRKGL